VRKVVITGVGIVAPTGVGNAAFWRALCDGTAAYGAISRFDATQLSCRVGGQVSDTSYEALIEPRKLRTTSYVSKLALGAAELALRDARYPTGHYAPETVGVAFGTAIGGFPDLEHQHAILLERGVRRVNPFIISGAGNHGPAIEVAAATRAQGTQVTFSSGCPSSAQAIGHGASLVAAGALDMCLAGGAETPLSLLAFAGLTRTQELSSETDDLSRASRPFDRSHAGMVLSEGGCFLVLESADSAEHRGATIYAEILASESSCDGEGLYDSDSTGRAGARAVHRLLRRTELTAADIDYVCAHANSSPSFDRKEVVVLNAAFGEFLARIPVSSIKGVLGHPFGASGAFQAAATALAIRQQRIPPTHNLEDPDPICELHHVRGRPREARVRRALVTSYGYGGINAYLLFGAYPG
jgi:3-oxoacyl-[acyl-carrier-protein] synthase II